MLTYNLKFVYEIEPGKEEVFEMFNLSAPRVIQVRSKVFSHGLYVGESLQESDSLTPIVVGIVIAPTMIKRIVVSVVGIKKIPEKDNVAELSTEKSS